MRIKMIRLEIYCSLIAIIPFSFLFEIFEVREPLMIIDFLCCLRLVKIMPLLKLIEYFKTKNL